MLFNWRDSEKRRFLHISVFNDFAGRLVTSHYVANIEYSYSGISLSIYAKSVY